MQTVFPLPPHLADLIAAGEVVQRPAAAVKELVENALDAGASQIAVEIQRGGMRLIRCTDDGEGFSPEDAAAAFTRHATSKIRCADDLWRLQTLGFRGEALPSIAAVSRLSLLTRRRGDEVGTSLTLEGGTVVEHTQAGCPEGTTVLVRDLFFNTPARQKFMKKDSTEAAHVHGVVLRAALSRPEVRFRLIGDGRTVLQTPGGSLYDAVYAALGREFAKGLLPVSLRSGDILVSGFIGKPENARASRNQQYFFVRRRPVYSRTMAAALEEGYKNALPSGRSPVCVLDATLPPEHFDCNVHPAKTEVKFQHDRALFDAVYAAVRAALDASAERPELRLPDARPSDYLSFAAGFTSEPPVMRDAAYAAVPRAAFPVHRSAYAPPDVPANAPAPPVPPPAPPEADYRVVGEVLGGYIVVEEAGGLALIDRHAAHERILYERLRAQDRELMPQTLLAPIVAALSPAEAQALLDRRDALETLGVCVEDFGGGSLRVTALPDGVEADDAAALLSELAQKLKRGGGKLTPAFVDELLHTVACKAAVKIGRGRSEWDAVTIADAVMTTPALKHCPHGRPVAVTLSKASIEKRFGR